MDSKIKSAQIIRNTFETIQYAQYYLHIILYYRVYTHNWPRFGY